MTRAELALAVKRHNRYRACYRQRRFFTFGNRALPESRGAFYRWGYRCVTFAVALLLCLLLSRP